MIRKDASLYTTNFYHLLVSETRFYVIVANILFKASLVRTPLMIHLDSVSQIDQNKCLSIWNKNNKSSPSNQSPLPSPHLFIYHQHIIDWKPNKNYYKNVIEFQVEKFETRNMSSVFLTHINWK